MSIIIKNPFIVPDSFEKYGVEFGYAGVVDRLSALKRFDVCQLKAVIDYPGAQKSVKTAAQRLLSRKIRNMHVKTKI